MTLGWPKSSFGFFHNILKKNNFLDKPIHIKRDFAGVITFTDLKMGKSPLWHLYMTLLKLHGPFKAEHFLQLESETQQKENSEPSEAPMELDMMHCYWPWDVEIKVQGPDRSSWNTWEGLWHPLEANAIAGLTTTNREDNLSPPTTKNRTRSTTWKSLEVDSPEPSRRNTFHFPVACPPTPVFCSCSQALQTLWSLHPIKSTAPARMLLHTLIKSFSSLISSFLLSLVLLSCFNHIPI